jgi:hypothetical protein
MSILGIIVITSLATLLTKIDYDLYIKGRNLQRRRQRSKKN